MHIKHIYVCSLIFLMHILLNNIISYFEIVRFFELIPYIAMYMSIGDHMSTDLPYSPYAF